MITSKMFVMMMNGIPAHKKPDTDRGIMNGFLLLIFLGTVSIIFPDARCKCLQRQDIPLGYSEHHAIFARPSSIHLYLETMRNVMDGIDIIQSCGLQEDASGA